MAIASMRIDGFDALRANLQLLGSTKIRAIGRAAVTSASVPVLSMAKKLVPIDSRTLRNALIKKIKTYRNGGMTVAIIGASVEAGGMVTARNGRRVLRKPQKYDHLVERGHRIAIGGAMDRLDGKGKKGLPGHSGGNVPPHPFIAPALNRNREKCTNIMRRVVGERLVAAAEKAGVL